MGMIFQGPAPGVQDPEEDRQLAAHEPANLLRQGKRDHEVMPRHPAVKLLFEPLPHLMVLTSRAMAVAAGAVDRMPFPAGFALEEGRSACGSAAVDDRGYRFFVFIRHGVAEARQILRRMGAENSVDRIHDHTPAISWSMILYASSWPLVVRWR